MINDLLLLPESRTLDFKREEVPLAKVLQTLVAFANTAGGCVAIGVTDHRAVVGVRDVKAEEERYANAIDSGISPPLFPEISIHQYEGKDVLVLRVPRQSGPFFVRAEGEEAGMYVRLGSTNRRADERTREELRRLAAAQAFDERPCFGAEMDDLDLAALDAAFAPTGLVPSGPLLETLGLVVRSGDERMPSNGGIVLFGTEGARTRLFGQARFRAARFKGVDKATILDRYDEQTTVLVGLDEVYAFVRRNTRTAARIEGMRRVDIPEYSPVALREILSNAAAHADYSHKGMGVKVFVYDDRIDVESPGGWPIGYSVDDFREGISRQRNKVVSDVIRRLRLAEHLGTGYQRIREDSEAQGYPMPEWIEAGPVLRVRLRPHPTLTDKKFVTDTTSDTSAKRVSPQERMAWFLAELSQGRRPTAEHLATHFDIAVRTAWRDLSILREAGRIVFVGSTRSGHYELTKEEKGVST